MTRVRKRKTSEIAVSSEAARALREGIARGDTIYELECLGVEVRALGLLEESKYKVFLLEDLLKLSNIQLLCIPNFGIVYCDRIRAALAAYHVLPQRRKKMERQTAWEVREGIRTMPPNLASNAKGFRALQRRGLQPIRTVYNRAEPV
jgi:hypothetical protein